MALATRMATACSAASGVEEFDRSLVSRGQVNVYEEARLKGLQAGCILGSAGVVILCAPYYTDTEQRHKVGQPRTV